MTLAELDQIDESTANEEAEKIERLRIQERITQRQYLPPSLSPLPTLLLYTGSSDSAMVAWRVFYWRGCGHRVPLSRHRNKGKWARRQLRGNLDTEVAYPSFLLPRSASAHLSFVEQTRQAISEQIKIRDQLLKKQMYAPSRRQEVMASISS